MFFPVWKLPSQQQHSGTTKATYSLVEFSSIDTGICLLPNQGLAGEAVLSMIAAM